jgi:hypothetical protein
MQLANALLINQLIKRPLRQRQTTNLWVVLSSAKKSQTLKARISQEDSRKFNIYIN